MRKKIQNFYIFLLSFIFIIFPPSTKGITIDIYPDGKPLFYRIDEDYNGVRSVLPGTIILFHGGIYSKNQWVENLKGNSTHHIQFLAEKNSKVIFEVSLLLDECTYVDLIGPFEIRNSPNWSGFGGNGLTVAHSSYILVTDFHIHHTYKNGMYIGCDNCIVKNNYVHDCVYMNYKVNFTESGNWGQSIAVGNSSAGIYLGKNNLVINNTVTESWGEGIDILYCDFCIARNNTVRNAFGSLLYADRSTNSIIENNFLYITTDDFSKNNKKERAVGIGIGTENIASTVNLTNITIRNNLVLNSIHGVQHTGMLRHYDNIKIVHNTFFNVSDLGLQFPGTEHPDLCKENYAINNIFSGDYNFGKSAEKDSWTIFSNGWVGPVFWRPLWDDKGDKSFLIKKSMTEVLFPKAKNECYRIECYLPRCLDSIGDNDLYGNLLIGKGEKTDFSGGVDFFGRKRNIENPTIGFSELCVMPDNYYGDDGESKENKGGNTFLVVVIVVIAVVILVFGGYLFIIRKKKKESLDYNSPLFKS